MRRITFALLVVLCGCSSKNNSGTPSGTDAGDDAAVDTDAGQIVRVHDQGTMADHDTNKLLAGVTVTEADQTATTDAKGVFTLSVPANTPMTLIMADADHTKLQWPEVMLSADFDRGKITTVSLQTFGFVAQTLEGYNHDLGVLYVDIGARASCPDVTGATVTVASPSGTSMRYFKNGIPNAAQTSVIADQSPHLAIYNVAVGVPVSITVAHPTCKAAAFPYVDGVVTFTGQNMTTEGGDTNTVARLFLE